jgi:hypothetical protein
MNKINTIYSFLILCCITLFLFSCGSGESSGESSGEVAINYCDCYEIEKDGGLYKKDDKLFTGICESKDDLDRMLELSEYKNGYVVTSEGWKDLGGEMTKTWDLKFKGGEVYEGYKVGYSDVSYLDADFIFTDSYDEYSDGKLMNSYLGFSIEIDYDETFLYKWYMRDGVKISEEICTVVLNFGDEDKKSKMIDFVKCVASANLPMFYQSKIMDNPKTEEVTNTNTDNELYNDFMLPTVEGFFRGVHFGMKRSDVFEMESARNSVAYYSEEFYDDYEEVFVETTGTPTDFAEITYRFNHQGLYEIKAETFASSLKNATDVFDMIVEHYGADNYGVLQVDNKGYTYFYDYDKGWTEETYVISVKNFTDVEDEYGVILRFKYAD